MVKVGEYSPQTTRGISKFGAKSKVLENRGKMGNGAAESSQKRLMFLRLYPRNEE